MTTGIVVAGGTSSRFGSGDKALATVGGSPMIRRVIDRLDPVVDRIVVNARPSQRSSFSAVVADAICPVRFAIDRPPDGGPVAGLGTALDVVEDETALVLACDLPFVQTATLSRLLGGLENDRVAIAPGDGADLDCLLPLVSGRSQPLCGAYLVDPLDSAIDTLDSSRNRSFTAVLEQLNVAPIPSERLPGGAHTFENVNTRDELGVVRARARSEPPDK